VTDQKIFSKLTQHWENEYHEDMTNLNVSYIYKEILWFSRL